MKFSKIFTSLTLCGIMFFAAGCVEQPATESSSGTTPEIEVEYSDTYLVKNGVSPYQIVIPTGASDKLKTAAQELQYFFSLSTDIQLPIIEDEKVTDTKGKYLSIGETSIMEDSGITISYDELNIDGYKVVTNGDAIVMCGYTEQASLYAVYGFMDLQFNLEIFSDTVFTYDETDRVKLIDVDYTDVPDIPFRTGGTYLTYPGQGGTEVRYNRYKMRSHWSYFKTWGHSHLDILKPSVYWNDHPDWFNHSTDQSQVTQLNWVNEEMWDAFANALIEKIKTLKDDVAYYFLGHDDNWDAGRDKANPTEYDRLRSELYDGSDAAMEIRFMNAVVRKCNAWIAENAPEKNIEFGMFAYQATVSPPVKVNDAGEYVPVHPDVVLEDNLAIQIAPIEDHVSYGYMDEVNTNSKAQFEGWSVVAKRLQVWGYSSHNFWHYYSPMNSWNSIKQNYSDYAKIGVSFLFEQGTLWKAPGFTELRAYLVSKLAWDTTLDTEVLIKDFITAYYGAGWEEVYEFFNLWRMRLTELEQEGIFAYPAHPKYPKYETASNFPKVFLDQCEKLLAKGLEKAEAAGDTRAYQMIECERLPVRYMVFEIHMAYYDSATLIEMVNDFQRVCTENGYIYHDENKRTVKSQLIDKWLANIK